MAVTAYSLRLQRSLIVQLEQITDRHTRDLTAAWVRAWDEVAPDLNRVLIEMLGSGDRVTRAQLLRSNRLRQALAVIAEQLATLARQTGVVITGDLQGVIDAAGGAQASILDSQLPPGFMSASDLQSWSRVDARQITAIVQRSTEQITSRLRPLSQEAYDVVRRELVRGVAAGSSPRETARRIVARAEGGFNGGLTRALTISRTETLDAHRAAARLGQAQHAEVLQGWVWLASLSPRTCQACLGMNGTVHAVSEPGPNGHQQCRCSRMPQTQSWADLGFEGIEEPASMVPDSKVFFDSLSADEQQRILGRRGYDAWRAGDFTIESWAVRQSNTGWRDSFVPAKAPTPQSKGGRSAA